MVCFDPGRQRLWMRPGHLGLLGLLVADPLAAASQPGLAELRAAGVVIDDIPTPEVSELVEVIANAALLIEIETSFARGVRRHTVWVTPQLGVSAEASPPPGGEYEYAPVAPAMLPFTVARIVNLRQRATPSRAAPLVVPRGVLEEALIAEEPDLRLLPEADGRALAELIRKRTLSWRMTSAWVEPGGNRHLSLLTVIDSADAGLWTAAFPSQANLEDAGLPVTLTPTTAGAVWRGIVALLPSPERDPEAECSQ